MKNFLMGSIAFVLIFSCLGAGYYFLHIKPQQEAELLKIEREKIEEQKRIAQQEEDRRLEEERRRIEEEQDKMDKIYKDTDGFTKCKETAKNNMDAWLDIKIGCNRNVPGAEGNCVVNLNGKNGDIAKEIADDYKKAIAECEKKYPDADLDLINYRENPYPHPEG